MKEKELEKQLSKIQKSLERKQIIQKAKEVARKYGENRSETYPYRIKHWSNFSGRAYSGEQLGIKGTSGWSDFGGEDIKVYYSGQEVFCASTFSSYCSFDRSDSSVNEKMPEIKIGELYINKYTPGDWERQLTLIYKNGPKKEKPRIEKTFERDVDKSKLEMLAMRLPIKI